MILERNIVQDDMEFAEWLDELMAYIDTPDVGMSLPSDIRGTAFQRRVWEALSLLPTGTTVSCGEFASAIGSPTSARAVAQACAANRVAVAVPCHRVVRQDRELEGYKWGIERKRALLKRAKATRRSELLGIRANVVQIQQPKNIGLSYCDIVRHTVKNLQISATTIAIPTSEKSELSTLMNGVFNSRGAQAQLQWSFSRQREG